MTEKRDGNTSLSIEECLAAMENRWKEKENMQQKQIKALLSTTEALQGENSMLQITMVTQMA